MTTCSDKVVMTRPRNLKFGFLDFPSFSSKYLLLFLFFLEKLIMPNPSLIIYNGNSQQIFSSEENSSKILQGFFSSLKIPTEKKNVLQYLRKFPGNFRRASSSHINCRALLKLAIVSNCHFYFHDFASLALIEKVFEILLCKKKFPDL